MKKILLIALCLVFGLETWAQEGRNVRVVIGMNNLTYTVKKIIMNMMLMICWIIDNYFLKKIYQ